MGTVIVGGGLIIIVGMIVLNMVRKVRQGKSLFCDGASCSACGADAVCRSRHVPADKAAGEEKTIHFVRQTS